MDISNPDIKVVLDTGMRNWIIDEVRRTNEIYAPKIHPLLKYAPYIMIGIIGAIFVFMTIYMMERWSMLANSFSSTARVLADAMKTMSASPAMKQTPPIP